MKLPVQFSALVSLIRQSQYETLKVVNAELVNLYWQVGEYISIQLAKSAWGDKTVNELANFIEKNHPDIKGFNKRGLYRMKQFYETYNKVGFIAPQSAPPLLVENTNKIKKPTTKTIPQKSSKKQIVSPVVTQFQISNNQYDIIVSPLVTQLGLSSIRHTVLASISWSHHLILLSRTVSNEEREFYIKICVHELFN